MHGAEWIESWSYHMKRGWNQNNMRSVNRITFKKRFKHFWGIYIFLLLDVVFIFYCIHTFGQQDIMIFVLIALGMFLLFFLPTLFLHIEYLLQNCNDEIVIDSEKQEIEYIHQGIKYKYSFKDIDYVEQFITPPLHEKRMHWFPWASYNYVKIRLRNNENIIVTCFLIDQLDLEVDSVNFKVRKVFYPSILRLDLKKLLD
jgi:hypothetical protein